ncbi:hypothetical protein HYQ46_002528 [Verticillium longisporum]|nr:hypothetical protein HYQ46_002528 [Verticillium longisporum]
MLKDNISTQPRRAASPYLHVHCMSPSHRRTFLSELTTNPTTITSKQDRWTTRGDRKKGKPRRPLRLE